METLLGLILAGSSVTLVDIDNAMYATGQISALDSRRRLRDLYHPPLEENAAEVRLNPLA